MKLGIRVADEHKKLDTGDDIRAILHLSGMFSARLDRFEEVSSRMRQLEWKLMKRAASEETMCAARIVMPSGD
jgi:hypothetical protein